MYKVIKNNLFYILFFIVIVIVIVCYSMFFFQINLDEIWCYSYSFNIANGLVPYRDFNMIVTPLFPMIGSVFLKIFGNYLLYMHIFMAIFVGLVMIMLYKSFKWKSLICYVYLFIYLCPTYNVFCFFWIFSILYLIHNKQYNDIVIGIIVSLCFLTKQTVGLCLFIPFLYYAKNKVKSIIIFLIPIVLCCIYLIYNKAFYEFIDYCFLGMFDFTSRNLGFTFYIFEFGILFYLFNSLLKSNFQDKECYYILMFQIMFFPICDLSHFFISIVPVCYYLVKRNNNHLLYITVFGIALLIFGLSFDFHIVKDDNFVYLRNVDLKILELDAQVSIIEKYMDDYEYKFYIFNMATFLKLYMNENTNKFDILNNGNFGYNGSLGYIKDINNICEKNSCIFFVVNEKIDGQLNKDIYNYVINSYYLEDEYKYFNVYTNKFVRGVENE